MTGKELFEKLQNELKERQQAVFLSACALVNLATEIRNYAQCQILGAAEKKHEAFQNLQWLIYTRLPRLVLELQDTFKEA